ncbi:MAG: ABC transporter permease [Ignavibacteria bacterium]|nr:ABC transporter permease [Ignavibacteria bacterium]
MNTLRIVYKNIKQRSLSSMLTILSVLLGVGLVTAILILKNESEEAFNQAATGYEIIVGPKGSSLQLTLSTVYQIGLPIQNMPIKVYDLLKNDKRVRLAIPYVFGDNYKNFRITGTVSELFSEFEYKKGIRYKIDEGSFFSNDFEAVIGKEVADKTGLKTGDTFSGSHGIETYEGASEHSEKKFKVTGILSRTFTPSDRVIFVSMNSVWELHNHENENNGSEDHHIISDSMKTISAVLLKLKSPVFFDLLRRQINENKYEGINAQAVLPLFEIKQLFDIIGNINSVILVIAYLVIFTAAVSILVSIYNSMNERMREIAIMRSLGARRFLIMKIIIFEGMFLSAAGAVLGSISGHIAVFLLEEKISGLSGIKISGFVFSMFEVYLITGTVILGIIVSIIPAVKAYRTDVSKNLNSGT